MIKKTKRSGQSLAEYALILALIIIGAILAIWTFDSEKDSTSDNIQSRMTTLDVAADKLMAAGS